MRLPFQRSLGASLLIATQVLLHTPASAATSVRGLAAEEMRLATIAHRMALANSEACARPEMMTGLILHDLTQYAPSQRLAVSRAFSLNSGLGVLQIVPGSAAARAGLQVDDEIVAIGKIGVEDPVSVSRSKKSFKRIDHVVDRLQSNLRYGPVPLLIRRKGQMHRLQLTGQPGCGGRLSLSNSSTLNAWADGKHIVVTTAMKNFVQSDDEIAFVIAHEMAHNILGHSHQAKKSQGIFGIGSANSKALETDADKYAVQLMSQAGYQPDAGVTFLKHSQRRLWWAFSLSHPSFARRIQSVVSAISNLRAQTSPWVRDSFANSLPEALEQPKETAANTNNRSA